MTPTRIWQPWETAWPAGIALILLLVALFFARRRLRPPRGWPALAGVFGIAVLVRLFVVPAWGEHSYDGHEAEFYDLFIGAREPNRGGTVLYPAMQWFWWSLGRVMPHHPRVPVVLMAVVGAASAVVTGAALGRLARSQEAAWRGPVVAVLAALVLALHPTHAAWSSSAYNVVLPFFFGVVVLWSGAVVGASRRPPLAVATLGAMAWVLVLATRMDAAVIGLPAALLALFVDPVGEGRGLLARLRARWTLLGPLAIALVLGGFSAYPLVFPGEVPGAGERGLAFAINWPMTGGYLSEGLAPSSLDPLWLGAVGLAGLLALRRWPLVTGIFGLSIVANHLLMSTFDDLADRHLLAALPGLAWMVAAGAASLRQPAPRALVALPAFIVLIASLGQLRERFYAPEERFVSWLEEEHGGLPRLAVEQARDGCGWINEDPRGADDPVASHFNVLDPREATALRGEAGCLRWCADLQDWRWSSRGVADRALRMRRLYELEPAAVVREPTSGYACLAWEIGARRCCEGSPTRR